MIKQKVLLVEDEAVLAEIISESLQSRGFTVTHTASAVQVMALHTSLSPDIIILDVMLPDGDGFAVAKRLRQTHIDTPIIFLTSRSLPQDVVEGFESGGNDYLKKPFSLEELIIRMKALLNRNRFVINPNNEASTIRLGNYIFEYPKGVLSLEDHQRLLTNRECEILQLLVTNQNKILHRRTLLLTFWNSDDYFTGRSLDVFMAKLRKYLKDDPNISILNIRGQGYKLIGKITLN